MRTSNNVHSCAFTAWISLHRYGLIQTAFFILLILSLTWMYFFGEPYPYDERGFFSLMSGYISAFIFPFFCTMLFFSSDYKFKAFIFAVLWGYLLALSWCAYWGIPYPLPITAAGLLTLFYKEIRPSDKNTKAGTILGAIIIWFFAGLMISILFSCLQYRTTVKVREYTQQALNMPVIKVIDSKGSYIYTEEYGLEKMYHSTQHIPSGSSVHRLPVDEDDGDVFIVAE